ncbi:MAG TPA: HD domain-containing protein [Bacteroidales bacterium]|nr:HD domain-containing protein [Bacteroidales bacterium]
MNEHLQHPVFNIISDIANSNNLEVFVIGGFVRDIILKRHSKDIDIVVKGSGIQLAQKVASAIGKDCQVKVFKNFGTAMLHYNDNNIEFVGARKESYNPNSRKPSVEEGSLEDDQNRRDFTINALAISLQKNNYGELIDPFNGLNDIKKRIIRTPLNPDLTFSDDPLRMMRAIRFATQLNFTILPETYEAISNNKERINIISKERIIDELNKIIQSPIPSIGFIHLDRTELLGIIFPQFAALKGVDVKDNKAHKDNFFHTLQVLDKISLKSDNLWLRWAALLHDIGKPPTKKYIPETGWTFHGHEAKGSQMVYDIFKMLKLPLNEKMKYVQNLVFLHLRPIALAEDVVTDSAVRRLLFEAGDNIDDLMLLCEADITSRNVKKVERFLKNFETVRLKLAEIEEKDRLRNWQPPISGEIIMETFGLSPCIEVGLIKTAIREAILDGKIGNNYEEAYQFMLQEAEKLNLKKK